MNKTKEREEKIIEDILVCNPTSEDGVHSIPYFH